jgi:hypothetical protein
MSAKLFMGSREGSEKIQIQQSSNGRRLEGGFRFTAKDAMSSCYVSTDVAPSPAVREQLLVNALVRPFALKDGNGIDAVPWFLRTVRFRRFAVRAELIIST